MDIIRKIMCLLNIKIYKHFLVCTQMYELEIEHMGSLCYSTVVLNLCMYLKQDLYKANFFHTATHIIYYYLIYSVIIL